MTSAREVSSYAAKRQAARLDVHAGGVDEATQERQEQLLQLPLHQVGEHVAPRARRPRMLLVHL